VRPFGQPISGVTPFEATRNVRTADWIQTPKEFATQAPACFYIAEVGQEASKAGPSPHISVPAQTDAAPQVGVNARVIFVQLPGTSTS